MIGNILCLLGLHRVVTTREGKAYVGSGGRGGTRTSGAAEHIHCFCYRPGCKYRVIIDTHSGDKVLHIDANGVKVTG